MDHWKKGGIVVALFLVFLLLIGSFLLYPKVGLTGALIGLGVETNPENNLEKIDSANGSNQDSNGSILNGTITIPEIITKNETITLPPPAEKSSNETSGGSAVIVLPPEVNESTDNYTRVRPSPEEETPPTWPPENESQQEPVINDTPSDATINPPITNETTQPPTLPNETIAINGSVKNGSLENKTTLNVSLGANNSLPLLSLGFSDTITITIGNGTALSNQKISNLSGNFTGQLNVSDRFGISVAPLGDLNGDGVFDLAVGADLDNDDFLERTVFGGAIEVGAVWILFLNATGSVRYHQKISNTSGNFTGTLDDGDFFGGSLASLGDLDADGVIDLAVGARGDDDSCSSCGAVWILFLNSSGGVKHQQKITNDTGFFTGLLNDSGTNFGSSLASLGDLDNDGVTDLAVGANIDPGGGSSRGAVWILLLNSNGTVKHNQKISNTSGNFTGPLDDNDQFGGSLASLGDLNGDGVLDLAVGAYQDDDAGPDRGAVWILFLNTSGGVRYQQKISNTSGNFSGTLDDEDFFGRSLANMTDLNGDGSVDLAVGASNDDDGCLNCGAVWMLFLNASGGVRYQQKISNNTGGFTGLLNDTSDNFGSSVTSLGDLDGNLVTDLAVGALNDDDGIEGSGAVYVILQNFINAKPSINSLILNTTNMLTNDTNQNLTVNVSTSDADRDSVRVIYNWMRNNKSITVLNMPFEKINRTNTNNAWDYSPYTNEGTEFGSPLWRPDGGFDGKGAHIFDGLDDHINITEYSSLNVSGARNVSSNFSIVAWFKRNNSPINGPGGEYAGIISKGSATNATFSFGVRDNALNERLYFYYRLDGTLVGTEPAITFKDNAWHHFVAVFTAGSPNNMSLYADGSLVGSNLTHSTPPPVSDIVVIGKDTSLAGGDLVFINGTIDELQVYNISLSVEQILALFNNKTNVIVANETQDHDNWTVIAYPNDGMEDGTFVISNTVSILTSCGTLTADQTLTRDISSTSTCFTIGASNIVLDCQGFNITYGTGGAARTFSLNNTGFNNVTIKNCKITEGSSSGAQKYAIEWRDATNGTILNNTFRNSGETSHIINLASSGNNTIANNTLITTAGAQGIVVTSSGHNLIVDNIINTTTESAILLNDTTTNTLRNNIIGVASSGTGIRFISGSLFNVLENNFIRVNKSNSYALYLGETVRNNTLVNNNLTSTVAYEILDESGDDYVNFLIYNNSLGEIRWNDNGSGSFQRNLTFNASGDGLGLGINLFIGNNSAALNISAMELTTSKINSSANLTLRGLPFQSVDRIMVSGDFITTANLIIRDGKNCNGTSCVLGSYNSATGVLIFNTTGFSSFAAANNTLPQINSSVLNSTNPTLNRTEQNLTFYNVTSDADGNSVKVIYNWFRNGSSLTTLNLPFEGVNNTPANNTRDYSGYANHGTMANEATNATWNASGGFDGRGAYSFDGTQNESIESANNPILINTTFSIELWFNARSLAASDVILAKWEEGANRVWAVAIDSDGINLRFDTSSDGTFQSDNKVSSIGAIASARWYHVVARQNSSDNSLFINGRLNNSVHFSDRGLFSATNSIFIGHSPAFAGASRYFNGHIDEVRIYNRSLSDEQIHNLFNNKTHEMASSETVRGEFWNLSATPNDGQEDGKTIFSNSLRILNTPPQFNETLLERSIGVEDTISFQIKCTDVDVDQITYYDDVTFFDIGASTGTVVDTPTANEAGTHTVNITCGDTDNTSQTFTYIISAKPAGAAAPPAEVTQVIAEEVVAEEVVAEEVIAEEVVAEIVAEEVVTEEVSEVDEAAAEAAAAAAGIERGEERLKAPEVKTVEDVQKLRKIRRFKVTLENKRPRTIRLFPKIFQEYEDPFFIVTRKTLGYSDSLFRRISGLAYSTEPVAGRLLAAEVLNPEQIILQPGERIEKFIEIREGLIAPRIIKFQFITSGVEEEEVVYEKGFEVKKKIFSGAALDVDPDNNILDIYAFIVPPSAIGLLEEYYRKQSALTGAATFEKVDQENYLLELTLQKKGQEIDYGKASLAKRALNFLLGTETHFFELYGPYKLNKDQMFIFAQQIVYDPEDYAGDYLVKATIYRGKEVFLESKYDVRLG